MIPSSTAATFAPPVMEARRWLDGVSHPVDRPLLNVSQAAPVDPPPVPLREAMAEIVMQDAGAHLYGPVLGLPALREELAARTARSRRNGPPVMAARSARIRSLSHQAAIRPLPPRLPRFVPKAMR